MMSYDVALKKRGGKGLFTHLFVITTVNVNMVSLVRLNIVFFTFLFLLCCKFGCATNCKGCVQLDSYSFHKVVSRFKASLVKFDVAYPYGEKHEQFAKVSESVRDVLDLLIAEVGVKDYGEKDNSDLAEKYGIDKNDFPVLKLLKPNAEPLTYSGEFKVDNILNFIRLNSDVYVGLPGCLEEFDRLALKFSLSESAEEKKALLLKGEELWDKTKGSTTLKSAEIYVKTMRKALEKENFIESEIKRVKGLITAKVTKEKANELALRLNILKSFLTNFEAVEKDEL